LQSSEGASAHIRLTRNRTEKLLIKRETPGTAVDGKSRKMDTSGPSDGVALDHAPLVDSSHEPDHWPVDPPTRSIDSVASPSKLMSGASLQKQFLHNNVALPVIPIEERNPVP
jgi:hypothetical protein